jgi:hypothetical protein
MAVAKGRKWRWSAKREELKNLISGPVGNWPEESCVTD